MDCTFWAHAYALATLLAFALDDHRFISLINNGIMRAGFLTAPAGQTAFRVYLISVYGCFLTGKQQQQQQHTDQRNFKCFVSGHFIT
jgi:hypothetical protein